MRQRGETERKGERERDRQKERDSVGRWRGRGETVLHREWG